MVTLSHVLEASGMCWGRGCPDRWAGTLWNRALCFVTFSLASHLISYHKHHGNHWDVSMELNSAHKLNRNQQYGWAGSVVWWVRRS